LPAGKYGRSGEKTQRQSAVSIGCQVQRHNIEYKARLRDVGQVEAALRMIGATDAGMLVQRDTYFRAPEGRLKLREMPDRAELIAYERDESGATMESRYTLTPIADPATERARRSAEYGVRGVVEKSRALWLYRNARIHLDHVAGLGRFLEIEVVEPRTAEEGAALLGELLAVLDLSRADAVRASYIDLLEATDHA
jgi:adenylate cyclase class IV